MKPIFLCLSLLFILSSNSKSQSLIIKGRVKCMNQTFNSTRGATNIVVVPTFMPSHTTYTLSEPTGYFEINTGVPLAKLKDKTVTVYAISRCANCTESAKRVFISEDQDRQNRNDNKQYVTIKDWMLNASCKNAELSPLAADSILRLVAKQPDQNLDQVSTVSALTGAPMFLNFLTTLTSVVGITGFPTDSFFIQTLKPGRISYGQFLLASPLIHSANTGFNFSPSRDMSEAVFWNASAIAFSNKPTNISLLTNLKNNGKLGGYFRLSENTSIGGGAIYTMQDEFRKTVFGKKDGNTLDIDTTKMKLKEYAVFLSPSFKVNPSLSLGITLKSVWQDFTIPHILFVSILDDTRGLGTFTDSTVVKQHFDVDVSATYKITNALQLGASLMNLAGTELYADAFIPGQANIPVQKQRSLGLGLTYKWQRLNVGTDVLFTEDGLYDASVGINYVPFNNALISGGFAVKQMSYSLAFRIKHFRIAYINDNNWLVNDQRKGKTAILNGQIYGGFIFDLN